MKSIIAEVLAIDIPVNHQIYGYIITPEAFKRQEEK
jgi:hypothetical protein